MAESANGHARAAGVAGATKDGREEGKLPLLEDVMQLARIGDVEATRSLLKKGTFTAAHKDNDGITPLHVRTSMAC
jgi:hypothetical protein